MSWNQSGDQNQLNSFIHVSMLRPRPLKSLQTARGSHPEQFCCRGRCFRACFPPLVLPLQFGILEAESRVRAANTGPCSLNCCSYRWLGSAPASKSGTGWNRAEWEICNLAANQNNLLWSVASLPSFKSGGPRLYNNFSDNLIRLDWVR